MTEIEELQERIAILELQQAENDTAQEDGDDLPSHVRLAFQALLELPIIEQVTVGGNSKEYVLRAGVDRVVAAASKAVESYLVESTPRVRTITRIDFGNGRN